MRAPHREADQVHPPPLPLYGHRNPVHYRASPGNARVPVVAEDRGVHARPAGDHGRERGCAAHRRPQISPHRSKLSVTAPLPDPAAGGRRVTLAAKFSPAEAALIDAARGETSRSEWLRDAALVAAQVLPARSRRAILAPEGKPAPKAREAAAAKCFHPVNRRIGGSYCAACGSTVKLPVTGTGKFRSDLLSLPFR
jgi:hypothetical protein